MDAKSKANFINSVAAGKKVPCPNCDSLNDSDSVSCINCGTKLSKGEPTTSDMDSKGGTIGEEPLKDSAPAFEQIKKPSTENGFKDIDEKEIAESAKSSSDFAKSDVDDMAEDISVFAKDLPVWDIVPPQIVVRRKKKK